MPTPLTRLAPSPTGALHLGNARTFLANWLLARQAGWRVLLRIDDVDGPRLKRGADQSAIDDLLWLGLDWDDGPVYQSASGAAHLAAARRLLDSGHAYPDVRSRSQIDRDAGGRTAADGATLDSGIARGQFDSWHAAKTANGGEAALRMAVPDGETTFVDGFCGETRFDWLADLGDFTLLKREGVAGYQLATVVDDAAAGVTHVVRGQDLLASTPRQMLLYDRLALGPPPAYWHLPLIIGPDGRKLAKRHGDTRLSAYREAGITADVVLDLLGRWLGVDGGAAVAGDFVGRFDLGRVSPDPVTFDPAGPDAPPS